MEPTSGWRMDGATDRRRNGKRRKGKKLTPFDIAWAIERWIAGETQKQIAESLGYADGSYVSTNIGMFVIRNLPTGAYEKYGPSTMHTRLPVRKELARLALEAYGELHRVQFLRAWRDAGSDGATRERAGTFLHHGPHRHHQVRKHAKLTRSEQQRIESDSDAILDAAMLEEARSPRSPRRERVSEQGPRKKVET